MSEIKESIIIAVTIAVIIAQSISISKLIGEEKHDLYIINNISKSLESYQYDFKGTLRYYISKEKFSVGDTLYLNYVTKYDIKMESKNE